MIIKCPECELPISDKAVMCPHCGLPLKPDGEKNIVKKNQKTNKRKRLPNGFGQIVEIKNQNLRNRFRACVSVGKKSNGRPIQVLLKPNAYFATYNDAYAALVEYNKNPYDLNSSMTVKELYEKWSGEYFKTLKSESSTRNIISSWAYCSSVYDMRACDLRARHIKGCMDDGVAIIRGEKHRPTAGMKGRIKSMFNLMLDYALEYEIVEKNYARTFNVSDDILKEKEDAKRGHIPYTDEEMKILWDNVYTKKYVDVAIIQCYSGLRPQEIGLIEVENVDMDKQIIVGGMKTDAGIDRIIPIHPRIKELIENKYKEAIELGSKYLINCTDTLTHRGSYLLTYDKYKYRYEKLIAELQLNPLHRAHDGRKHFITMAKKNEVNEYAIKYIVGHSITDITEKIYTQRDVEWLKEEIRKIK